MWSGLEFECGCGFASEMHASSRRLKGWAELDDEVRDTLVRQDIMGPATFRNLTDGSDDSISDLPVQLGGVTSNVLAVRAL